MARRFRFPLQTLLKVRRLREREAQRKVGLQRAALARLDQLDEGVRREIAREQQTLLSSQRQPRLEPRELSRTWAWIGHLRAQMTRRQVLRAELRKELEHLQAEFQEARKQLRIIEKLRERRFAEYRDDRQRHEQAAFDELAQQLHSFQLWDWSPDRSPLPAVPIAGGDARTPVGRAWSGASEGL